MRAGKHVMIEIPIADTLKDSERLVKVQKETGLIAMGGHTRRFNPEPPVDSEADSRRRAEDPVDGCADVLLPPHQHERGRKAAQLDGPPALAPRLPHGRFVPVSDRRNRSSRQCAAGPDSSRAQDRDGHEHSAQSAVGRGLHAGAVVQQQRTAGDFLPLHLRQRDLHRALRRSGGWRSTADRSCQKWMCR